MRQYINKSEGERKEREKAVKGVNIELLINRMKENNYDPTSHYAVGPNLYYLSK